MHHGACLGTELTGRGDFQGILVKSKREHSRSHYHLRIKWTPLALSVGWDLYHMVCVNNPCTGGGVFFSMWPVDFCSQ